MASLYPDVPIADGVPQVLRDASNSGTDDTTALTSDSADLSTDAAPVWGVFDATGATQVLTPDSIVSFDYNKEYQNSTFPVEQGGFQTYNKVETPYTMRLSMTKGGSVDDRSAFLEACAGLADSILLYTVITPEGSYVNANFTRNGLTRSADRGAQLLTVEMVIEEIRNSATSTFTQSTAKSPASADVVNNGSVQTKAPTAAQTPQGQPL